MDSKQASRAHPYGFRPVTGCGVWLGTALAGTAFPSGPLRSLTQAQVGEGKVVRLPGW